MMEHVHRPRRHPTATVLFQFTAEADDELTVAAGMRVHVLQPGNDWCLVEDTATAARGLVPATYIAVDLPPGWGRSTDEATGHPFYHNAGTGVSQWECPRFDDPMDAQKVLPEIVQLRRGREEAAIEMRRLHKRLDRALPALAGGKDPGGPAVAAATATTTPAPRYTFSGGDLVWLRNGLLVFAVQNVAVMVDTLQRQTPLTGHKRIIQSICAHPNLSFFATQDAISVFIWSSAAPDEPLLSVLRAGKSGGGERAHGLDRRDTCSVSFSPCGSLLSVLLNGAVEVFDWQRSTVVAKVSSGSRSGFDCKRLLFNPAVAASQRYALVSCGPSFIKFWTLSPRAYKAAAATAAPPALANEYRLEGNTWTPNMKSQPAGAPSSPDTFTAIAFSAPPSVGTIDAHPFSTVFTAHGSGSVWIWEHIVRKIDRHSVLLVPKPFGRLLAVVDDVHSSPVRAMHCSADDVVVTCDDVSVSVWQHCKGTAAACPLDHLTTFDLPPTVDASVGVAVAVRPLGVQTGDGDCAFDVAIGTSERSILRLNRAAVGEAAPTAGFEVSYLLN